MEVIHIREGHKDGAPIREDLCHLKTETPGISHFLTMHAQRVGHVRTQREGPCLQAGKISHQKPNLLASILNFWPPELRENRLLLFKLPSL